MSKSMKVRGPNPNTNNKNNSPFMAHGSPMEQLQPVVRSQNSSKQQHYRVQQNDEPVQMIDANLQRSSFNNNTNNGSNSRARLNRSDLGKNGDQSAQNHGSTAVTKGNNNLAGEESSKLNLLIEEYRRENDRCSRRINELQRKLNATANRK